MLAGVEADTTANRLSILAVLQGMRSLRRKLPVRVFSANDYVVEGAQRWLPKWLARNWKTRDGKPVVSRDLWEELAPHLAAIEWVGTGGVAPPPLMEAAKQAAVAALAAAQDVG